MPRQHFRLLRILFLASTLVLSACGGGGGKSASGSGTGTPSTPSPEPGLVAPPAEPSYWPTSDWVADSADLHGFTSNAFANLATEAATALPYYTSLLVIKDGYLIHESYHPTASATVVDDSTLHQLWSVTKSVTSMVVGRAVTLGDLDNLDITLGEAFPSTETGLNAGDPRQSISMRHALQMRSGLAWNEGEWLLRDTNKDPLLSPTPAACSSSTNNLFCKIVQKPHAYEPGSTWNYSTYDSYLISAFFTQQTGSTLASYANSNLLSLLGISSSNVNWGSFGTLSFGGGLLGMRSRDLAKLGLLMMYNGKWDGQQLISEDWLTTSLHSQGNGSVATFDPVSKEPSGSTTTDIRYGMQWWLKSGSGMTGQDSISAFGLGGQQMHIFRDKNLIILITCDSDPSGLFGSSRGSDIQTFISEKILNRLND